MGRDRDRTGPQIRPAAAATRSSWRAYCRTAALTRKAVRLLEELRRRARRRPPTRAAAGRVLGETALYAAFLGRDRDPDSRCSPTIARSVADVVAALRRADGRPRTAAVRRCATRRYA